MAVLRPLKVVIENYPEGQSEELEAVNHPDDPAAGTRKIRFGRELYIERDDFMENPPKKFFRLSPGTEVRLRYAYFITCREVVKNAAGEVVELRCTYDPATRGGNAPDGRKVKATMHWVSAADAMPAEVRLYNPLFAKPDPTGGELRRRSQSEFARGAERRPARAGARRRQSGRAGAVRAAGLFLPRPGLRRPAGRCSTAPSACATPAPRMVGKARLTARAAGQSCATVLLSRPIAAYRDAGSRERRGARHGGGSEPRRARAGTWDAADAAPARGSRWPGQLPPTSAAAAPAASRNGRSPRSRPGRLLPWLPVAFGVGIVALFHRRPRAGLVGRLGLAAFVGCAIAFVAPARPIAFPLALGFAARRRRLCRRDAADACRSRIRCCARPAVQRRRRGFVEVREERERTDRIVVRVHAIEGAAARPRSPSACASAVRKGTAPPVGSLRRRSRRGCRRRSQPLRPGGYDFARDLYFQRHRRVRLCARRDQAVAAPPPPAACGCAMPPSIEGMRDAIDARIRAVLPGDAGAIASALITGKRDAISTPVNDAMYISSLAHVLSISGYHMAVVAGIVFFVVARAARADPGARQRAVRSRNGRRSARWSRPTFYLLLSGAEVATQRSFIMIAIVLVGVMVDRPALTLRTLAVAALGVLLLAPEAVVHPSFQMSFAATLALIAAYQRGLPWMAAGADTSLGARVALWGGREIVGADPGLAGRRARRPRPTPPSISIGSRPTA